MYLIQLKLTFLGVESPHEFLFSLISEFLGKVLLKGKLNQKGLLFGKHAPLVFRINVFECGE